MADDLQTYILKRIYHRQDGCWEWVGETSKDGYGLIKHEFNGRRTTRIAHRVIYERMIASVPKGKVLDHLCRRRDCCNPHHLEVVTQSKNCRRGFTGHYKKAESHVATHCPNGHIIENNTYSAQHKDGRKYRRCKSCLLKAQKKYYLKKKRAA